jgi:hypothetical protein
LAAIRGLSVAVRWLRSALSAGLGRRYRLALVGRCRLALSAAFIRTRRHLRNSHHRRRRTALRRHHDR